MPIVGLELRVGLDQDELDAYIAAAGRAGITLTAWVRQSLSNGVALGALLPAPEARAEPEPPPRKERAPRAAQRPPSDAVPRGFQAIMETVEMVARLRIQAVAAAGASKGIKYNKAIAGLYAEHGVDSIDRNQRVALVALSNIPDLLRSFKSGHPTWASEPDLTPSLLEARWTQRSRWREPVPARPKRAPGLRKTAAEPGPVDTSRAFGVINGKPGMYPTEELIRPTGSPAADVSELDRKADKGQAYGSFREVDLRRLTVENPYDARVLRRFSAKVLAAGRVVENAPQEHIATAIRDIRGKEAGDTPTCAHRLVALGVVWGSSGSYRFRPEFVARIHEVETWLGD